MPRLILSKNQPLWICWQSAMYQRWLCSGLPLICVYAGIMQFYFSTVIELIYCEQLPRLIHKTAWWCAELDLFETVNSGAPLKLLESWAGNHLVNVHIGLSAGTGLANDNSGLVRQSYPKHNQRPRHKYFFTAKVIVLLITKVKKMSVVFTTIPLSRKNKYPYKPTI